MITFQSFEITTPTGRLLGGPWNLDLNPRERTALLGPSGSGKTLFIRALFGALPKGLRTSGTLRAFGVPLGDRRDPTFRRRAAWVPQHVDAALNPYLSAADHVTLLPTSLGGASSSQAKQRLTPLLEALGLPSWATLERRTPEQLSGGQRQRLLLAMALAHEPTFLALDEPTTGLDAIHQRDFLELLDRIRAERGLGWLWVTHDVALARAVSDRIILLDGGRIAGQGPTHALWEAPPEGVWARLLEAARKRRRFTPQEEELPRHTPPPYAG